MKYAFTYLVLPVALLSMLCTATVVTAQEVHQEFQELVKAEVLEVVMEEEREITGTDTTTVVQELRILLKEGEKAGEVVPLENDLILLREGDAIFVNRLVSIDGTEYYTFKDIERRGPLLVLVALFIGLVIWLSGMQGVRAVLSLGLSFGAIAFLLIPALLHGYSPALASLVISGLILSATLFFTHGFKPRVVITFFGTFGAVFVTCALAWLWVTWMRFSGFSDDTSVYLNFATGGTVDLSGLLLGGIIIGLLGVLDDVSITQASVVQELKGANPKLGFKQLYTKALRVGRDHVGSLVNTLALAYAGASLPLILLYSYSASPLSVIVNQEVIAAEILRIIVGSIGLILAVPLTTALAAWYFKDKVVDPDEDGGHSHGHSHGAKDTHEDEYDDHVHHEDHPHKHDHEPAHTHDPARHTH
jgi:uncharacterized membrane protein